MRVKMAVVAVLMVSSSWVAAAGDPAKGKAFYASCAGCHGADGMGNAALNAPRLAGQLEGYLVTQLKNFKAGIRGTAEGDNGGAMMAPMAAMLATDQAIEDVAAYLAAL
ncbi:MAG: c-type cytochrome [Granulosicoccus sp.]|nr:c-type cytochrome [Granulosicoccus sp.]